LTALKSFAPLLGLAFVCAAVSCIAVGGGLFLATAIINGH